MATEHLKGNGKEEIAAKFRDAKNHLSDAKDSLADAAEKVKDSAYTMTDKMLSELKDHSEDLKRKSSEYVRKKPLAAIGFAALAGFIFALFLRRR